MGWRGGVLADGGGVEEEGEELDYPSLRVLYRDPDDFLADLEGTVTDDLHRLDTEISKRREGRPWIVWEGPIWGGTDQSIGGYGDFSDTNSRGGDG